LELCSATPVASHPRHHAMGSSAGSSI
jgi:hypothetical protein